MRLFSELFSGSLKQGAGQGSKVLDPYIGQLENDVSVTYYMLPLPISVNKVKNDDKPDKPPKKRPDANSQQHDAAAAQVEKVKKAKTPGKGKNKREPVPAALKGMHSRTPQGDQICFGFNLNKCSLGAACTRKHVCAVPGCYQPRPQSEHQ